MAEHLAAIDQNNGYNSQLDTIVSEEDIKLYSKYNVLVCKHNDIVPRYRGVPAIMGSRQREIVDDQLFGDFFEGGVVGVEEGAVGCLEESVLGGLRVDRCDGGAAMVADCIGDQVQYLSFYFWIGKRMVNMD